MFPTQKSSEKFHCGRCDHNTCRLSQFKRHLQTDKHKILHLKVFRLKFGIVLVENNINILLHYMLTKTCFCINKETESKSESENDSELTNKEIIKALISHTERLAKIMENGVNNNHNHNTNSNNKTFNLNLFFK